MNAPWITCRPEIKAFDCTVRDGGLVNDHLFGDRFVRAVYDCCVASGVDYMEIGYKNSEEFFSPTKNGPWRFCKEDDVRRIVGDNPSDIKLSCMIDAGKSNWRTDVLPKKKSVIDVIRVAFYVHQVPEALEMIANAADKGYDVWANLMAISTVKEVEIDQTLDVLAASPVSTIVIVDSYGSLNPDQTEYLTKKYLAVAKAAGKEVGMHAHNNQQLAFANSIEAVRRGATCVDATLGGLGRGAGNCPMELLLGFLRNPKFKLRPVYQCLEEQFRLLKSQMEWGPYPEFMITGQFNQHPRAAIAARESEMRNHYAEFYDSILQQE